MNGSAKATAVDRCRQVVEEFYDALRSRDAARLGSLVSEHVHDDAVLRRPESLPGGGEVVAARRIGRFFAAAATMEGGPVDVAGMTVASVVAGAAAGGADVVEVVVRLELAYDGVPCTAVEWWTFRHGRLERLDAFYWDTAAMVGCR